MYIEVVVQADIHTDAVVGIAMGAGEHVDVAGSAAFGVHRDAMSPDKAVGGCTIKGNGVEGGRLIDINGLSGLGPGEAVSHVNMAVGCRD